MKNWTGDRLRKWRDMLCYGKYKMGKFMGITNRTYRVLESGYIIPVKYSDELDALYHTWIKNKTVRRIHNPVQIAILREFGLDRLIVKKVAA